MFRAFSFPMKAERSRNKERLEASLAGLCELELLKHRQECLVLSALCLGDCVSGRPAWGDLRPDSVSGRPAWGDLRPDSVSGRPAWGDLRPDSVSGRPAWGDLRPGRGAADTPSGGASDDHGLRRQPSSLQCTPWGIMASIEQQVAELRVNSEAKPAESPTDPGDSRLAPGEVVASIRDDSGYRPAVPRSLSAPCHSLQGIAEGTGETTTGKSWNPKRGADIEDDFEGMEDGEPTEEDYQQAQRVETYIVGLIQRRALPPRPSKPRTSLAHDARAITVARQSSLCRKEDQHSSIQLSIQGMPELSTPTQGPEGPLPQVCHSPNQEHYLGTGFIEDSSLAYHHLQQNIQHQPVLCPRPRQPSMVNTHRSTSLDYPSCRVLHQDSSNSEPDSPQHFHSYPSPPPLPQPHSLPSPDEQLVNAEYIPAQPCRASTRTSAHHHSNSLRGSGGAKPNRSTYSPERGPQHQEQQPAAPQVQHSRSRGGPKKCRLNEDRGGATRKPGKKACRSQSENSLQRVPERKYNTVERDGGGSGSGGGGSRSSQSRGKKSQQGSGGYRRWRSTLELSQDEADQPPAQPPPPPPAGSSQRDHCARRTRKSRPAHTSYSHPHHNHHHGHHHQHVEYQLESEQVPLCPPEEGYAQPGQGESESSTSEADSPDSSSLSSDSDESGGLVWPQQLPPQLSLPSPPAPPGAPLQPKAFVKIKASHALKKKILRFRTGSLKVMTTV